MNHNDALQRVKDGVKTIPRIRQNLFLYGSLVALGRVRTIDGTRNIVPEPFDFFNHNGNILSSTTVALCAGFVATKAANAKTGSPIPQNKRRSIIIAAALSSGAFINALVETRTGLSMPLIEHFFGNSTPDPIDYAYGMAGSAIGCGMIISMQDSPDKQDEYDPVLEQSSGTNIDRYC